MNDNPVIPDAAVEAALDAYLAAIDADRGDYKDDMRAALAAAAPRMLMATEWAVFRASDGADATPVENGRYKSREAAQASIDKGYLQPQFWEPLGRKVGEWSK